MNHDFDPTEGPTERDELILNFCYELQRLETKDVLGEIAGAGFTDEEIGQIVREISHNDTWKFERLRKDV